ncbi:30S RIBOSOMAL PROTEIN S16 [Mycoplasmopsis pulmonis]|uniref:Small ribosomal subunit protein bS16 n=1 Tax=Mycoplasmopsis pulmonis (strain UAB CTIP) TaxID=272635 RepID=RS16_MYCPU|nr:30S ribosomal protein S16 [Mycoplasmopsis pulmonis]Q98Q97.1 RecName: Full=Small ribosomal subunit protein bS16; AltName: Full=30S ribosomal protein S16 [Mycoplasmopsis pulmonis UAB CTIP]MDZ7293522.1 30S ribosomal protein S16 [Mycoplasmopsis pulmonis]CAC13642.1 30S RIBOSOMAL PROTEIN S16 [Mycoplasmopsis pulmonis]VEU68233.1 ribosomal protein S16 [Mycoplasmopsis pulmonis]
MVKIRLKRVGKKFNVIYKIVVADSRAPRDGRFIEEVGNYNPHSKSLNLKKEAIISWLNQGVKPSDTVKRLLTREKVWEEFTSLKNNKN